MSLREGGNYGVAEEREVGGGEGKGPMIGTEARPEHKGHPPPGEQVKIKSRKAWGSHRRALT